MEILNQFGINPVLLLAQVVNFLVLLFILKKFLYKPILKVLGERKQKIEDSLKNAEEIEKRLAETNEKIDTLMVKTSKEIREMMDEANKERALHLEETKEKGLQMARDIIKKAEAAGRVDALRMQQEVMNKMADIVAVGLEKVTGKIINKKEQKVLIEKEVRNLS
ncbi:MAG: F0F1 ATP synthase subunit B [Candidatus Daviesbacteria bacterium]|nr:F0F1 ATP synthase subunit B [Candidatus Daviesbacteria bacterium]